WLRVRACANEHVDDRGVVAMRRPMERCGPIGLGGVDTRASVERGADRSGVSALYGVDERATRTASGATAQSGPQHQHGHQAPQGTTLRESQSASQIAYERMAVS